MSSAAGIEVLSTFEGISINCKSCGSFLSTVGVDEMTASAGMSSYPVSRWGPTFADVKQIHSTSVPANTASTAYAEWELPLGAESVFSIISSGLMAPREIYMGIMVEPRYG